MTLLSNFLGPEDVRQVHLNLFSDLGNDYLRQGPFGDLTRTDVERKIRNVRSRDIHRTIDSVDNFTLDTLPEAWSWYMALACGIHLWPDANHRTALISFNIASSRGMSCFVSLPDDVSRDMVVASKAVRNADFSKRGHYYNPAELSSPAHPYRRVFATYEDDLAIQPI